MVKNPAAMQETWVLSLGWEDSLEEGMASHTSIIAWRILMDRGAWASRKQQLGGERLASLYSATQKWGWGT